jgi:PIN domain nuclease of toxin-antitoxin system
MEIAMKQSVGKLPSLTLSIEELIQQLISDRFIVLPISNLHIVTYASIPLHENHKDPFDRLLLATAFAEHIQIISADENFKLYTSQIQIIEA